MHLRKYIVAAFGVFCFGVLVLLMRIGPSCVLSKRYASSPVRYLQFTEKDTPNEILDILKEQRNNLARQLNEMRQKLGRIDCETSSDKQTNEVGGWCRNTSLENGGEHITDTELVKGLSKFFKGKTVGSFGDGPGAYKREIEKIGEVKLYDAYDGAPFCEETSEGRVKFLDLTVPQFGLPLYDWIISLEVAEHIPEDSEAIYLDNLARHCREGIVMSWAGPEQTGLAHINKRPGEYAIKVMEQYGFKHNESASFLLRQTTQWQWLSDNINVFVRKNKTILNTLGAWHT